MASESQGPVVSGILALTPAESKRLIAKAVVRLPEVRRAREEGRIIVGNGTTTGFVAAELLGEDLPWFKFCAGLICDGMLASTRKEDRMLPYVFDKGVPVDIPSREAVAELKAHDVFVKSGNAVDPAGNVGVLMGDDMGGTIGTSLGVLAARGINLVCPVGLEKLVPSVVDAAKKCGSLRFKYALGSPVGLMPVTIGKTITEIQALDILTGVSATHVASGGIGGSEGAVVLVVEGTDEQVSRTIKLVQEIRSTTKNIERLAPIAWREVRYQP
ncbi:MAG: hypothetical protein ACYC1C_12715 [Chloroflexota bacterium]